MLYHCFRDFWINGTFQAIPTQVENTSRLIHFTLEYKLTLQKKDEISLLTKKLNLAIESKVSIEKSHGEVSLVEQDTIENVS